MEISKDIQERIHSFVKELAPSSDVEIEQYVSEILSDKEFHDSISIRRSAGSGTKYFSYNILAIDQPSCIALYTLSRSIKPGIVVETGVASGISSAYILRALDKNNHGKLFSIDLPWQTKNSYGEMTPHLSIAKTAIPPNTTHSSSAPAVF